MEGARRRWGKETEAENSTNSVSLEQNNKTSVQRLLQDYATDSDELTRSESMSTFQPTEKSFVSQKSVSSENGIQPAAVDTGFADTLSLKAEVTQVLLNYTAR